MRVVELQSEIRAADDAIAKWQAQKERLQQELARLAQFDAGVAKTREIKEKIDVVSALVDLFDEFKQRAGRDRAEYNQFAATQHSPEDLHTFRAEQERKREEHGDFVSRAKKITTIEGEDDFRYIYALDPKDNRWLVFSDPDRSLPLNVNVLRAYPNTADFEGAHRWEDMTITQPPKLPADIKPADLKDPVFQRHLHIERGVVKLR